MNCRYKPRLEHFAYNFTGCLCASESSSVYFCLTLLTLVAKYTGVWTLHPKTLRTKTFRHYVFGAEILHFCIGAEVCIGHFGSSAEVSRQFSTKVHETLQTQYWKMLRVLLLCWEM